MIDIREIRIGNVLINNKDDVSCLVWKLSADGIGSLDKELVHIYTGNNYSRMPISEDILLGLGFCKKLNDITKERYYRLRINGFCIDINKYSNTLGRDYGIHIDNLCCDSVLSGDIQYLHQLQNYIYDSTKQELDITNII